MGLSFQGSGAVACRRSAGYDLLTTIDKRHKTSTARYGFVNPTVCQIDFQTSFIKLEALIRRGRRPYERTPV